MKRWAILIYGGLCYAASVVTLCYGIGFLVNFLVPKSIDTPSNASLSFALAIDILLLSLFAAQHSVMARRWFKRWWTRIVSEPAERSTYCLLTCVALFVAFAFWQSFGYSIWTVSNPVGRAVLYGIFACGWMVVFLSSFLINHFDLFGLRQVWLYFRGRAYQPLPFATPFLYRWVRHPLYVGLFLGFWATPDMTMGHMLFAAGGTLYILVAVRFEERDLVQFFGESYRQYQQATGMLFPKSRLNPISEIRSTKSETNSKY